MAESSFQFEKRKQDHLRIALDPRSQAEGFSGLDQVQLIHEALPDFNFSEVDISTSFSFQGQSLPLSAPFFISSMTAGHEKAAELNSLLAELSANKQILMGVGSQRRELSDPAAREEWREVRKRAPRALLMGNLGIAQVIQTPVDQVRSLIDALEAVGLFVHLNPLQECLQPEGTPDFRGGAEAIARLVKQLGVPVVVKEVGCGFSKETLQRLFDLGVHGVDVSGLGGTHWGRIEGYRSAEQELLFEVAQTFQNWGLSTVQSLLHAKELPKNYSVWSSGGVRDGLHVAKLLAMGSENVGLAQPWLKAAMGTATDSGASGLNRLYEKLSLELRIAMFCTGVKTLADFKTKRVWKWHDR